MAVIECDPGVNAELPLGEVLVFPWLFSEGVAKLVPWSEKLTVPVGVPNPELPETSART